MKSIEERNKIYKQFLADFEKAQKQRGETTLSNGLCTYFAVNNYDINEFPEIIKHKPKDHNVTKYGGYWFHPDGEEGVGKRRDILLQAIRETEQPNQKKGGSNVIFICTSNKDRSPALEKYFAENYPEHNFRSAGVNKFFTGKNDTHYLTLEDIDWADMLVCAERIHIEIIVRDFNATPVDRFKYPAPITFHFPLPFEREITKQITSLDVFEFTEASKEDYLNRADYFLKPILNPAIKSPL